jgi:hypothetical protein
MNLFKSILVPFTALAALFATVSLAQEVEPPFTWKGKGQISLIAEQGINEITFNFELAVDADGGIQGRTSGEQGQSEIKHVFYGERMEHELPGHYSQRAILVLAINEGGINPLLAVLNGRLLAGRFFAGEALVKRYEPHSPADRALGVGNPIATPIDEERLPAGLQSALKQTMPVGVVKIEGAYQN